MRSYSVVGPCQDGVYRIVVKLLPDSRGGSKYMWSLAPGARLKISTPGNHFELGRNRPHYLLLAGGIGITPIYSMALALAKSGADFRVLYACRTRGRTSRWPTTCAPPSATGCNVFVDDEGARIDLAAEFAALAPGGEVYVCGPIGMLEAAKRTWQASGRPMEQLRFETFGNSGRFATSAFEVKIPRLGLEIVVPQGQTMLEALEAAGVAMISDCRKGECGLCALRILETRRHRGPSRRVLQR